jgi:hypothetical protein
MGMDMVPVYEGEDASSDSAIQIDAATTQRMNLKTAPVVRGPVRREVRAVGIVAYNEEGLRDITTKYEGWIERLDVNATWTPVKEGAPLFEIYSPDLYNAQVNYLVALKAEGAAGGSLTRPLSPACNSSTCLNRWSRRSRALARHSAPSRTARHQTA